jgi:aspartate/tyrosine/aromatic aminotransferase
MAPPDPILGLTAAFREDSNPDKINLGVGVYKDANGATPVLNTVKAAEKKLVEMESTKSYLPIDGSPEYGKAVREMMFGKGHELVSGGRAVTLHTPGGTGGLRVAGDFLNRALPGTPIWLSSPTWANHNQIFKAAGMPLESYPYYDADAKKLDFEALMKALSAVPEGHVVLLHGCCHNPTGMDPTAEEWEQMASVLKARGLIPLVDFAYQGLARGIDEDAEGVRILAKSCPEMLVVSSFSKNFGLYRERTGAMTIVGSDAETAQKALSHAKQLARANYSNPPAHGGSIVATILSDDALRAEWLTEVADIRNRIRGMRELFVKTLKDKGVTRDFSFITRQNGMFSFSGLTRDQVDQLRENNSIYIVGSGRINVAGMTEENMDRLCGAIAAVL